MIWLPELVAFEISGFSIYWNEILVAACLLSCIAFLNRFLPRSGTVNTAVPVLLLMGAALASWITASYFLAWEQPEDHLALPQNRLLIQVPFVFAAVAAIICGITLYRKHAGSYQNTLVFGVFVLAPFLFFAEFLLNPAAGKVSKQFTGVAHLNHLSETSQKVLDRVADMTVSSGTLTKADTLLPAVVEISLFNTEDISEADQQAYFKEEIYKFFKLWPALNKHIQLGEESAAFISGSPGTLVIKAAAIPRHPVSLYKSLLSLVAVICGIVLFSKNLQQYHSAAIAGILVGLATAYLLIDLLFLEQLLAAQLLIDGLILAVCAANLLWINKKRLTNLSRG